jgi:hypothetical protein
MKKILLCLGLVMASASSFAQESNIEKKFELVQRNRRMPFVASDSYVKQDNKVIVNYTTEEIGENGTKFIFALPNETVVAEAILKRVNAGKVVVQTMIDNKMHTVGLKNIANIDVAREIAMFLSDNKYI